MSFLKQLGESLNANVITLSEYTTFKAGVQSSLTTNSDAISAVRDRVVALEGVDHTTLVANAKSEAIASAKSYTDAEVVKVNTAITNAKTGAIADAIAGAKTYTDAEVVKVNTAITDAKTGAIADAIADATAKVTALSTALTADINTAKTAAINAASADATSKVGALSNTLTADINTAKGEAINAAATDATSKVDALSNTLTTAIATKVTQASAGGSDELAAWTSDGKLKGSGYTVGTSIGEANSVPTSDAVVVYVNTVTSGVTSAIHPAVGGKTQLRLIDTTSAVAYPDRMLILVEDMGQYRLDRESEATDDDKNVIAPTLGTGRWLRFTTKLTDHNLLSTIQGGKLDEYYHLTASSYNAVEGAVSKGIVTDDDAKLTKIAADGTVPSSAITYTTEEWAEFVAALTKPRQ